MLVMRPKLTLGKYKGYEISIASPDTKCDYDEFAKVAKEFEELIKTALPKYEKTN